MENIITGYGKYIKLQSNGLTLEINDNHSQIERIYTTNENKISLNGNIIESSGPIFVEYHGGEHVGIDRFDGYYAINHNGVDFPDDKHLWYSIEKEGILKVIQINQKNVNE